MLASSTQLQNRSFHVVEGTRTSTKCQKMKNARAKRAKILFFIVKYANLWGFCCRRRRRGCLSSLICERHILELRTEAYYVFLSSSRYLSSNGKKPEKNPGLNFRYSLSSVNNSCDELKNHNVYLDISTAPAVVK